MKSCLNCAWFHPLKQEDLADRDIYIGTCSRSPPEYGSPSHNPYGLPFVKAPNYCGEWKEINP